MAEKLTVFNPAGYPPKVTQKQLAPRLEGLDGKTLYLVDCRFDDSVELLKQVQAWFAARMPSVTTKLVQLNNMYSRDDPKTWELIRDHGDAAIVGVGH
jgi:hypothetical protein